MTERFNQNNKPIKNQMTEITRKSRVKFYISFVIAIVVVVFVFFYLPSIIADSAYPLAYQDLIVKYSNRFGVNPNLVAGVIYSESHFNAGATSPVGARGLMQIMPATGAGIARQLGEGPPNLYDPDTNIRFGTFYIGQLVNKYGGNIELAAIAYNGGCALADYYATYGGSLNAETHGYRFKVIGAKQMYDQLYGEWWKSGNFAATPTAQPAPKPGPESIMTTIKNVVNPSADKAKKPNLVDLIYAWLIQVKA